MKFEEVAHGPECSGTGRTEGGLQLQGPCSCGAYKDWAEANPEELARIRSLYGVVE